MKKLMSLLLVTFLLLTPVIALAQSDMMNGDLSPDEGYVSPYGEEQYRRDKLQYDANAYQGYNIQLDVPMYMQKNNYYGAPACVEMIIDYLIGPSHNQEYYAKYMKTDGNGTEIFQIEKALNDHQDLYRYDKRSLAGYGDFMWRTMFSLDSGVPFIADICTNSAFDKGDWRYASDGHYLVISGMYVKDNGDTTLIVKDPWLVGSTSVDSKVMYQMIYEHWDRALVH